MSIDLMREAWINYGIYTIPRPQIFSSLNVSIRSVAFKRLISRRVCMEGFSNDGPLVV